MRDLVTNSPRLLLTSAFVLVICAAIAVGEDEPAAPGSGVLSYPADEIERLFRELPEKSGIGSGDLLEVDGPVIELEPYIVVGEKAPLLMAALRRRLDQGPDALRLRIHVLAPVMAQEAELLGRINDRFFDQQMTFGPRDRPSTFYLTNRDASRIGRSIGFALKRAVQR